MIVPVRVALVLLAARTAAIVADAAPADGFTGAIHGSDGVAVQVQPLGEVKPKLTIPAPYETTDGGVG